MILSFLLSIVNGQHSLSVITQLANHFSEQHPTLSNLLSNATTLNAQDSPMEKLILNPIIDVENDDLPCENPLWAYIPIENIDATESNENPTVANDIHDLLKGLKKTKPTIDVEDTFKTLMAKIFHWKTLPIPIVKIDEETLYVWAQNLKKTQAALDHLIDQFPNELTAVRQCKFMSITEKDAFDLAIENIYAKINKYYSSIE